jgi:hypothetical protein
MMLVAILEAVLQSKRPGRVVAHPAEPDRNPET